jgi:integrase
MPMTAEEYTALLEAVPRTLKDPTKATCVRVLFQLTLPTRGVIHDSRRRLYRVEISRQMTGTHVSVVIPNAVAEEVLAIAGRDYVFWDGKTDIVKSWTKYAVSKTFDAAGLVGAGHMRSHRLRDTFAVYLLENSVPLEEVSKALDHESIKTTEKHYAK